MNDFKSKYDEITLELLDAIEERSDVSQRYLSARLGIALGLTNSYLKRCARKGFIKVRKVPTKRYFYYLTPKGFAEKSRLTARFLSTSLTFYRQSVDSCDEQFNICHRQGWRGIALCGVSDLAEIALMRANRVRVDIVGCYDPDSKKKEFASLPVWHDWYEIEVCDAYLITDLKAPLNMYRAIRKQVEENNRVLVPRVLGLKAAFDDCQV